MYDFLKAFVSSFIALIVALIVVPGAQQLPTEEVFLYWGIAAIVGTLALPRLDALAKKMRPMGVTAPVGDEQVLDFGDDDEDEIEFVEVLNV